MRVYILNGPLVSAALGSQQKGKLGSTVAIGLKYKANTYTHTHTHCNEQVMLRHRLLKSVIIINLSLHLSPLPLISISLPSLFLFFPAYISEQASGNPSLSIGGNEFID